MREAIASINGKRIPYSQAGLPLHDLGLVHGAAVTEMVRTFHHKPFRLDCHLERLRKSLDSVGFGNAVDLQQLQQETLAVLLHNTNMVPKEQELGLIIFVTAGWNLTYVGMAESERARQPTIGIHTFELPYELWADQYANGQQLIVSDVQALPAEVIPSFVKSRSRLHWVLSNQQVKHTDPHAIAILADANGHLTETAAGNFFIVKRQQLVTPPENILFGISRQTVIDIAKELGMLVREAAITPTDVLAADEAFTTSTPYCMLPVTRFNQQTIGNGTPGAVYQKLLSAWSKLVQLDIADQMQMNRENKNPPS